MSLVTVREEPMTRLLAEDLVLLCWDDDRGAPHSKCSSTLPVGVSGALLLDAVFAGAVTVEDDRALLTSASPPPSDPVLAGVVDEVARRRRAPKASTVVQRLGTRRRLHAVRDRLVQQGVLRAERSRWLGVFPHTRHPVADPAAVAARRQAVRDLLLGATDPAAASVHDVALAGLSAPTRATDVLVDRDRRREARDRASSFAEGHGIPGAVGDAIEQAQAAAMTAVVAAAGAAASSSSSGS